MVRTLGARHIEAALLVTEGSKPPPPQHPMSADGVRWEHIYRVYELCDRNVSESARRLNMQRHLSRESTLINEPPPLMDEKNSITSLI